VLVFGALPSVAFGLWSLVRSFHSLLVFGALLRRCWYTPSSILIQLVI